MHNCYSNRAYMHDYCNTYIYYFISFFSLLSLVLSFISFFLFVLEKLDRTSAFLFPLVPIFIELVNDRSNLSLTIGAIELVNDRRMEASSSLLVVTAISLNLTIGATWALVSSPSLAGASSSSLCSCLGSGSVLAIAFSFMLWCCREWFKNSEDSQWS